MPSRVDFRDFLNNRKTEKMLQTNSNNEMETPVRYMKSKAILVEITIG
jgi:hypothetical protein